MNKLIIAVAVALLATAIPTHAVVGGAAVVTNNAVRSASSIGIGEFVVGQPVPANLIELHQCLGAGEISGPRTCRLGNWPLGDIQAENFNVYMIGDKVIGISLQVDYDDAATLLKALTKKYGKPSKSETSVVQNGFGAKFRLEYFSWRGEQVRFLSRNPEELSKTILIVGKTSAELERKPEAKL